MSHFHSQAIDQAPETNGLVLHSAGSYDFFTNLLLQPARRASACSRRSNPATQILDVVAVPGVSPLRRSSGPGRRQATGLDPSPEMIGVARKNAARSGLTAKIRVGRGRKPAFPDASFDVVLNRLMLHHLPGDLKQRGLAEMHRVLKPGGPLPGSRLRTAQIGLLRMVVRNHMTPYGQWDVQRINVPLFEGSALPCGNWPDQFEACCRM